MVTTHTPGEYTVHYTPLKIEDGKVMPGFGHISAPTDQKIFNRPVRKTVAFLPNCLKSSDEGEIIAAAHLMAAAPALLAACKTLKSSIEKYANGHYPDDILPPQIWSCLTVLDDAIKKAEK